MEELFKKYIYCDIYRIQVYDVLIQELVWVCYLRINNNFKIQIKYEDFEKFKQLGLKETII